jgi:hypothetical protein
VDALWPNVCVGNDSLANTVTRLRRAINDEPKNPVYIDTVQRKSYRWLQSVEEPPGLISPSQKAFLFVFVVILLGVGVTSYVVTKPKMEKFPFTDLTIKRLEDGRYEFDVGLEEELTEEGKEQMFEELQRIIGDDSPERPYTVDLPSSNCSKTKVNGEGE